MDVNQVNKSIWEDIYQSGASNLSYPNENLVRYLHYLKAKDLIRPGQRSLDYGFGSGNNLQFMMGFGLDTYGAEISEEARSMTLRKLPSDFDSKRLAILDSGSNRAFPDNFFDLVVAWQVLYYNTHETLKLALEGIYTFLKPGGIFLGTMARTQDVSYLNSQQIGSSPFDRVAKQTAVKNQRNSIFVFYENESQIREAFSLFRDLDVGYFESALLGIVGSHWVICGKK